MKRRFEFISSRKNRYRLSKITQILKITILTIIGVAIIIYLMTDKSNPNGIVLIFLIYSLIMLVVIFIIYLTGFTDEHKIITLTNSKLRSELSPSNNTFKTSMKYEIRLKDIGKIKVHNHGFTVYPKKRTKKIAWHWSQYNDQYLQLIYIPKVLNGYEELLDILKETLSKNSENSSLFVV